MIHLRSIWPKPAAFRDLLGAARGRLHDGPLIVDAQRDEQDAANLARPLLRCCATTHVDLHCQPPIVNLEVCERPRSTRLGRYQASQGPNITNLWHEPIRLGDLERHLLLHLDGQTDAPRLVDLLAAEVQRGGLVVQDGGRPLSDAGQIRQILERVLPGALQSLARKGLLVSDP